MYYRQSWIIVIIYVAIVLAWLMNLNRTFMVTSDDDNDDNMILLSTMNYHHLSSNGTGMSHEPGAICKL